MTRRSVKSATVHIAPGLDLPLREQIGASLYGCATTFNFVSGESVWVRLGDGAGFTVFIDSVEQANMLAEAFRQAAEDKARVDATTANTEAAAATTTVPMLAPLAEATEATDPTWGMTDAQLAELPYEPLQEYPNEH